MSVRIEQAEQIDRLERALWAAQGEAASLREEVAARRSESAPQQEALARWRESVVLAVDRRREQQAAALRWRRWCWRAVAAAALGWCLVGAAAVWLLLVGGG